MAMGWISSDIGLYVSMAHFLIIEARFYEAISDLLAEGTIHTLQEAGHTFERVSVPGALEIPGVVAMALHKKAYDGYIALGCVIRGETSHYDIVAHESARGLMDLSVNHHAVVANGILTVENDEQAFARADRHQSDKGGFAARTCIRMLELKKELMG